MIFLPNYHTGEKYKSDDDNLAAAVDSVGSSLAGDNSYKDDSN